MHENNLNYKGYRNSHTTLNEVYFWTITINQWYHLLNEEQHKMIIIDSLRWLCKNQLIEVYGYVIMPNHVHLLWNQLKMNGKELPKNSFEKFTAKALTVKIKQRGGAYQQQFAVTAHDRRHSIWQRDPLAIRVFSREMAAQKLEYIHFNPLQEHWRLCRRQEDYRFSSALFYEKGIDEFGIVTHYMDRF